MGGGIAIERRRPQPGLALSASVDGGEYGSAAAHLDLSGRRGWFGGTLVGTWATTDAIDANGDRNLDLPGSDRYSIDAAVDAELGRKQQLRLGGHVYDESQRDGPAAYDQFAFWNEGVHRYNRENVELQRTQGEALYEAELGDGSRLRVALVWAERSQDVAETESYSSDFFFDTYFIDERRTEALVSWSRPIGQRARVRAGASHGGTDYDVVDINFNKFTLFLPADQVRRFALQEQREELGVWIEAEMTIGGRLDLSGGLRYTDFRYTDNEAAVVAQQPARLPWLSIPLPEGDRLLPRAALTWTPLDELLLRFSAGAGFRVPEPIYDEVCCGRRFRNNRGIVPEQSESYGVEVTFQPSPRFRLGGSAFLTDFENRTLRMASLSYLFRPSYQNVNVPEVRHSTLAFDTRWEAAAWLSLDGSISWTEAENRTAGRAIPVLIDYANTPVWKAFTTADVPYTPTRRAAVAVRFTPPRTGLDIGLIAQHTGPMLIQELVQDFVGNPDLGFSEVHFDSFVSSDDYWVANLSLSRKFPNGLVLYGGVDNVLDYVQSDLGRPEHDTAWGPLRGRYVYAGIGYRYDRK